MSSGDPNLDTLLTNLDTAGAPYVAAAEAGDLVALAAATPAVQAASDALAAYTVPVISPPPPPPPPPPPAPPTTPLTLAHPWFTRSGNAVIVECLCSTDVHNATIDHPLGTKIGADSGQPTGQTLIFAKGITGGVLNVAPGTVVSIRGWSAGPVFKPTNVLTLTV